jgi:formylglycine-generating enzyme required for sulfatase activity
MNRPMQVNVAGNTGMSYDLNFMNTGLSQITSEGPLMISAGDSNHYENLTLTTGGTGDIVMDIVDSVLGLKVLGSADGGYAMKLSPTGNMDLSQDLAMTGGILTVAELNISDMGKPVGTPSTGGSMSADSYYYVITALNGNGETTESTETDEIVVAATGLVALSWVPVHGATSYKIYRTTVSGTYADPAYIANPTGSSYTDTAAADSAGEPPSVNTTGGRIGVNIADATPDARIEVLDADTDKPQLRLAQSDAVDYADFEVDAAGGLTISLSGDDIIFNQTTENTGANLWICEGLACPSITLTTGGNLVVENKIYLSGDNENMPRHSCPTGWVLVPGSSDFGTEDFCVMKYEAKKDATTKNPSSVAAGTPWVNVSWHEAKNACVRIGAHLMTDAEWMTVARNAEAVAGNWTLGVVGNGYLFAGHNDNSSAAALAASTTETGDFRCAYTDAAGTDESPNPCPTNTAAGSSGTTEHQVRILTLSNNEVLWDLAGNVWEWTDARCDTTNWYSAAGPLEWNDGNLTDYEQIVGGSTSYTGTNGVGKYYGCTASGNAFERGGLWNTTSGAGVFTLILSSAPTGVGPGIGFRCAR